MTDGATAGRQALSFRYGEFLAGKNSIDELHEAAVDTMNRTGLDLEAAASKVMKTDPELAKRVWCYFRRDPAAAPKPGPKLEPIQHTPSGATKPPGKTGAIA